MSEDPPKVVLTIAGFDPSSGAGITADLKTIAAHHFYGVACITALTVQSTQGVRRVHPVDPKLVRETLETLIADIRPAAVKIGMLASVEVAQVVADCLGSNPLPNTVLDPLFRSSSGATLLDVAGLSTLRSRLLARVDVVTPNLEEAGLLTDMNVRDLGSARAAARKLVERGTKAAVVTGGHLTEVADVLAERMTDSSIDVETFPREGRDGQYARHRLRLLDSSGLQSCPRTGSPRRGSGGQSVCHSGPEDLIHRRQGSQSR
jgi:hydroxymethylpyrimidine/phosphomethylpyrimidine kinase